jgi:DNA-directed RNA polymerase specialized sigma24 family protein
MYEFRPPAVVQADTELAIALRAGDEDAVRQLFDRYGPLVYTVGERLCDGDRAADITVHTFLQAWRNSEAFEPGRSFGPWLATVARQAALHGAEHTGAERADDDAVTVDRLLADPGGWSEPPADLGERVVAAVISEAHLDPVEIYTSSDLVAAQEAASRRGGGIRSLIVGAVGALIFLLLGIFVLSALGGSDVTDTTTIELRPTGRLVDAEGSIDVADTAAGLAITVDAAALAEQPPGSLYAAWVVLNDGTVVSAGTFRNGVDAQLVAAVGPGDAEQFLIALATPITDGAAGGFDDRDVILRAPLP